MSESGLLRVNDTMHITVTQTTSATRCNYTPTDGDTVAKVLLEGVMWRQDPAGGAINFLRPALVTLCPACEQASRDDWAREHPPTDGLTATAPPTWSLVFGDA